MQGLPFNDFRQAEQSVAAFLRSIGYTNVRVAPTGPDDGIDVLAGATLACQVKAHMKNVGRPDLQRLVGASTPYGYETAFFSLAGYSRGAFEYAEKVKMPLFRLRVDGTVLADNQHARALVSASSQREPEPEALARPTSSPEEIAKQREELVQSMNSEAAARRDRLRLERLETHENQTRTQNAGTRSDRARKESSIGQINSYVGSTVTVRGVAPGREKLTSKILATFATLEADRSPREWRKRIRANEILRIGELDFDTAQELHSLLLEVGASATSTSTPVVDGGTVLQLRSWGAERELGRILVDNFGTSRRGATELYESIRRGEFPTLTIWLEEDVEKIINELTAAGVEHVLVT